MSCSCGGNHSNPLDCNNRFRTCDNPCKAAPGNTPQCESLPSQIENFTLQFFGTVVKTEVEGQIVWSLPCNLDVGLPNNPRGIDEGLACYFLRLFHDGIVGLTGPPGTPGTPGTNGNNAYTVTLKNFTQPTIGSPIVQVVTQFNPAIRDGIYVNIAGSGWYLVNENDGTGTLLLTLVRPIDGISGTVTAGKLVVPSGFPGATGPQGAAIQGPQGPPGPAGNTFTTTNAFYFATVGTDFPLPLTLTQVDFVNSAPQVLLPTAGLYLITAIVGLTGGGSADPADVAAARLWNTSINAEIPGTNKPLSGISPSGRAQIVISARVESDAANQTIAVFGSCSASGHISVAWDSTSIVAVKIE